MNTPYEHLAASPEEVLKQVNDQLAKAPSDSKLLPRKAQALSQTEDLEGALAILNELARAKPHQVNVRLDRAHILRKLGRFEDAVHDTLSAAEASNSDRAVHLKAANLLLRLGRSDAALGCYKSYWNLIADAQLDYRWELESDLFGKAAEPIAEAMEYCIQRAEASATPATEAGEWLVTARRLYSVVDRHTPEPTRNEPTPTCCLRAECCDPAIRNLRICFDSYDWRKEMSCQLAVIETRVAWRHGARDTAITQLHSIVQAELRERNLLDCGVITTCTSEGDVQVVAMRKGKIGAAKEMRAQFAALVSNHEPCDEHTALNEATLCSLFEVDANGVRAIAQSFVREDSIRDTPAEITQASNA